MLREQIELGDLKPGELVPSENLLCRKYDLSRNTVIQAIQKLSNEGLLLRQQGRGTFVADKKTFHEFTTTLSFKSEVLGMKKVPETILKVAKEITSPDHLCKLFQISIECRVYFIQRLRIIDGQPFAFQTSYLPKVMCPDLLSKDLEKESLFGLLTETYLLKISHADEIIICSKADKFESSELRINEGDPVFRLERKTYLNDGKMIEFVNTILPGARCNIHINLNYK